MNSIKTQNTQEFNKKSTNNNKPQNFFNNLDEVVVRLKVC
jgi:hypothetical protein